MTRTTNISDCSWVEVLSAKCWITVIVFSCWCTVQLLMCCCGVSIALCWLACLQCLCMLCVHHWVCYHTGLLSVTIMIKYMYCTTCHTYANTFLSLKVLHTITLYLGINCRSHVVVVEKHSLLSSAYLNASCDSCYHCVLLPCWLEQTTNRYLCNKCIYTLKPGF